MSAEDHLINAHSELTIWELNENSTRIEVFAAAPSDDFLIQAWWSWVAVGFLVGIFSLIVGVSIITSRNARRNSFNLYLVYLSIPDFTFSCLCGLTCLLNAINKEYLSGWMCNFQSWYVVFGIGSNAWINACVTRELHQMLCSAGRFQRYCPPTRSYVTLQALASYLFNAFLGIWGTIDAPNWPFYTEVRTGLACLPIFPDKQSSIYFGAVFLPLFVGLPSFYIIYVTSDVWRRGLLPPSGRRRLLAIYFARLILVFYFMWIPTVVTLFMLPGKISPTTAYLGGLWSHLQGAVSAGVSMLKPDVYIAVRAFVTCQPEPDVPCPDGFPSTSLRNLGGASAFTMQSALDSKGESRASSGPVDLCDEVAANEHDQVESAFPSSPSPQEINRIDGA